MWNKSKEIFVIKCEHLHHLVGIWIRNSWIIRSFRPPVTRQSHKLNWKFIITCERFKTSQKSRENFELNNIRLFWQQRSKIHRFLLFQLFVRFSFLVLFFTMKIWREIPVWQSSRFCRKNLRYTLYNFFFSWGEKSLFLEASPHALWGAEARDAKGRNSCGEREKKSEKK